MCFNFLASLLPLLQIRQYSYCVFLLWHPSYLWTLCIWDYAIWSFGWYLGLLSSGMWGFRVGAERWTVVASNTVHCLVLFHY
jgi:hypothetical protein